MNLEIAGPQDNAELIEFFKEFPVKGAVEFKLDRKQDFFGTYKLHSDQYRTYILRDKSQKIQASASFVLREVMQDGVVQKIALATDLRVSQNRAAILEWSQHFLPVMQKLSEELKISQFFSVINLTEPSGLNLFVRPRTMKRPLPRYYLYRKFNLITIHGKFPWAPAPLPHVKIRRGSPQNMEALLSYVLKRSQYRPFSSVWDLESLKNKIGRLPGLQISDFFIAFDAGENVIGCLAPWHTKGIQDWIPRTYSLRAHNFRQFLKFGRILGWTRTLSKPVRSTGLETPLNFKYLTHIHVDNEDIFESLIHAAYEAAAPNEFLCYAQVQQDIRLLPPEHWVSTQIPHALYAVVPPLEAPPAFLHPSIALNPEIEAHLI